MIVGWLEDPLEQIGYKGGAELDSEALRAVSPHELVSMPPGKVAAGCDAYVVGNCVYYGPHDLEGIDGPLVKIVNDAWRYGDPVVRADLLEHAVLTVLRSPLHESRFAFEIAGAATILPSWVDLEHFRQAARGVEKEERVVWLAHLGSPERRA
ncbi:MAG: hypothetical protein M3364_03990, partial [Actinomycetota bacterium]|nr:hypothetical protein [Actinomycetota bacterium]